MSASEVTEESLKGEKGKDKEEEDGWFYFSCRTFGEVGGNPGPLVASDETYTQSDPMRPCKTL